MTLINSVNATSQGYQTLNTTTGAWTGRTFQAGVGIALTNADGTVGNTTISSTGGGLTWSDQATILTASSNHGYFIVGTFALTLPASPANGDIVALVVDGAFTVTVTANTGQTIKISTATSASAGTAVNTANGDSLYLVYRSTNTRWESIAVIGNFIVT